MISFLFQNLMSANESGECCVGLQGEETDPHQQKTWTKAELHAQLDNFQATVGEIEGMREFINLLLRNSRVADEHTRKAAVALLQDFRRDDVYQKALNLSQS